MTDRVVLDACVLYPTVMREVLIGVAGSGAFAPLWSDRILEEWARAGDKFGPEHGALARGEQTLMVAGWPDASVPATPDLTASLYLPDPNDTHVLASAITGGAIAIITMNLKDFPRHLLAEHGLVAVHPDAYLHSLFTTSPETVAEVVQRVRSKAEQLSEQKWPVRKLLKKARLPRLAKALEYLDGAV